MADQCDTTLQIITVIGLPSSLCNIDILGSKQWFGQFGHVQHICIAKHGSGSCIAYLKYSHALSAAKAIQKMHLYPIPPENNIIKVHYNLNDHCAQFINHEESFQSVMFEDEIQMMNDNGPADSEAKQLHTQCIGPTDSYDHYDASKLKEIQSENDRIRTKHCALITDFNVLQQQSKQECAALKTELHNAIVNYKALQQN
eukprot:325369_1